MPPNYRPIVFQTGLTYIAQNAVKKYGSLADQFVFDEVDTKWIKEYTKSLKRR